MAPTEEHNRLQYGFNAVLSNTWFFLGINRPAWLFSALHLSVNPLEYVTVNIDGDPRKRIPDIYVGFFIDDRTITTSIVEVANTQGLYTPAGQSATTKNKEGACNKVRSADFASITILIVWSRR